MDSAEKNFDQLQAEAERLPANLIQGMAERDGPNDGGLTLTREHIITLNQYANHVFSLPGTTDAVIEWLGYSTISEAELMPSSMCDLHKQLQQHGRSWVELADISKALGFQLASSASSIDSTGQYILKTLEKTVAIGKSRDRWESISFDEPVELTLIDKGTVKDLVGFMDVLRKDVAQFAENVTVVGGQTKEFRDVAREVLAPLVIRKLHALKRRQSSGKIERLREDLVSLDNEIKRLGSEYDHYVKAALAGLAAGPLGAVITGSIYGSKAEKVRKERNARQAERAETSQKLKDAIRLEGLLEELNTQMGQLETRLRDVLTASSHLHSAWDMIGKYIDASITHLNRVESNQQLYKFALFFGNFVDQWKGIGSFARHMNGVFDDAASIK